MNPPKNSKIIPGFDRYHRADTDGNIWSRRKRGSRWGVGDFTTWKKLKPIPLSRKIKHGRVRVYDNDGICHREFVHRLVLLAFRGPCPPDHEGLHDDDDPKNNRLANLKWGTRQENIADSIRNGTWPTRKGTANGRAKLSEGDVLTIRAHLKRGELSQKEIAKIFGVSQTTISEIHCNNKWNHVVQRKVVR